MSSEYTRSVLRIVVGQICQTIGWHSINSTPLEFLVDLMEEYISRIYRLSHQYAETLNRTEGNLDDVGLAFRHLGIDVQQLAEYVRNVDSVPCVVQVPRYPIPRENHLNFLKPGSREVVTRPVHIHEHLPAMYPEAEHEEEQDQQSQRDQQEKTRFPDERSEKDADNSPDRLRSMSDGAAPIDYPGNVHNHSPEGVFKRPCDPLAEGSPVLKRMKLLETNSESRPLREIHSVMMTTSGFLSPAREGKLPEPRTPIQARPDSPPAPSYPMVPPEIVKSDNPKKIKKAIKKNTNVNSTTSTIATTSTLTPAATANNNSSNNNTSSNSNNSNNKNNNGHSNNNITIDDKKLDKENKKMNNKNRERDILFKADKITEVKVKKNAAKETNKPIKSLKPPGSGKRRSESISPPPIINEKDDPLSSRAGSIKDISPKFRGGEKIVTSPCPPMDKLQRDVCDKLPSEPDKQKLNIFKKISKPRDEMKSNDVTDHHQHHHNKYKNIESRENSPGLMIDEPNNTRSTDFDRKQHMVHTPEPTTAAGSYNNGIYNVPSPGSDIAIYDDSSLPPTPRTPDVPAPPVIPPQNETKVSHSNNKKRKEKISKKKSDNAKATFKDTTLHKHKGLNDMLDGGCEAILGRPKTPEPLDTTLRKGPPPYGGLPYYSGVFPGVPAPGLIPTGPGLIPTGPSLIPPLFPRFPMPPLGRGVQPPPIPNNLPSMMPGRPPFLPPGNMKIDDYSSSSRTKIPTDPLGLDPSCSLKNDFEKGDKISRNSKERISPLPPTVPTMKNPQPPRFDSFASISAAAGAANNMTGATAYAGHQPFMETLEKLEKVEKKPKKHKVDKKDKMKKKKEKKEKHKDKLEKSKESKREKLDKIKEKKEKKEKRKDKEDKLEKEGGEGVPKITLKLGKSSPRPPTPDNPLMKKITIKPLVKKPEDIVKREASPELAKISALVTRPPKPKVPKMKEKKEEAKIDVHHHNHQSAGAFVERPPVTIVDGHQVWICPGCGKQDDGSPMVGCDDCDAWYHWVCVGMQVPPAEDENWYCKMCINKQQELHHDKKKKKRKKKVKIST